MDVNYSYDRKFEGNILIVGQTGPGKVTFIQNIAKNNLFEELKEISWMSEVPLLAGREKKNISECLGKNVNFEYPQSVDEFNIDFTFVQRNRQTDEIGRWQFHKQKYLTSSQALCKQYLLLKSHLHTVTDTLMNIFHTETLESIDYTLKYQILQKKCLTVDTPDFNNLGLSKLRTGTENGH